MIRFKIRGVYFRMPLMTLLTPLLATRLGISGDVLALLFALGMHETAHLAAAFLLRVNVTDIRILPFGASMRMENPYHLPRLKLALIAISGPAANLFLLLLFSSLAQWNLLSHWMAKRLLAPNLALLIFNLLPALPLDGGRILCALLSRFMEERRALIIGIFCGRALALLLISAMIFGGIKRGVWNISFLFAAIFIITSERDEKKALTESRLMRMQGALDGFDMQAARLFQIEDTHSALEALSLIRPKENAYFILTHGGAPIGLVDCACVLRHMLTHDDVETPLRAIPFCPLKKTPVNFAQKN